MNKLRFALSAALVAVLSTVALHAQDSPFLVLHQEIVHPSMAPAYEQVTKEFVALVHQHHDKSPAFFFTAFAGTDYVYSYVTPISDISDVGKIFAGFGALSQAVGEAKWNDVMKRGGAPVDHFRESILMDDPNLSYVPAQPRLKPEEAPFYHFDLYYVQPGREPEARALAREFKALFTRKNVPDGYRFLETIFGAESPLFVVVSAAKDPVDYAAHEVHMNEMLGPEGKDLFERAASLCRRIDHKDAWVRPDLSLPRPGK